MTRNKNHKDVVLFLEMPNTLRHTIRRIATRVVAAFVVVAVVIGGSTLRAEDDLSHDDWPGFRQGVHPGVAVDGRYPTKFDLESRANLEWKVATTGLGHSSPVVSGDHIFVTAAFSGTKTQTTKRNLILMSTVSQILIAILLGFCIAGDVLSVSQVRPNRVFHGGRAFLVCITGIGSLTLLQLGADVFDYQRCPIRSWLGSHLAISLGLATALLQTVSQRWPRRINITLMVLMGLSVLFLVPAKDHAYRHAGPQSFVVVGIGIVPLALALMISLLRTRSFRRPVETGFLRDGGLISVAMLMLTLGLCGFQVAFGTNVDYLNSIDVKNEFFPATFAIRAIGLSAVALATSLVGYWIIRSNKRISHLGSLQSRDRITSLFLFALNGSVCTLLFASLAIVLDFLILRSSFLQYHLPGPGWHQFDFRPLLSIVGVFAVAAIVAITVAPNIRRKDSLLGNGVTVLTIVAGAIHLAVANGGHNAQHLIRSVTAFDRHDGSVKWTWQGFASPAEVVHRENSQATPTPCLAGNRIVAYFGSTGLVCLDTKSGNQFWSRKDLPYKSAYGAAASPVIARRHVVIVGDAPTSARITAVELDTGRTAWEHDRSYLIGDEDVVSGHSSTPLVVDMLDRSVVVVWAWNKLISYESETGDILSEIELIGGGDHVASAAGNRSFVYFGRPSELLAIRKSSLITNAIEIAWRTKADSNCVSPVATDEDVFTCSDHGIVCCIDASTGKLKWRDRLKGEFRSSPIVAGRHLYLANLEGTIHLLDMDDPNHEWKTFEFREPIEATPVALDSRLIIRTEMSLFSFRQPERQYFDTEIRFLTRVQ